MKLNGLNVKELVRTPNFTCTVIRRDRKKTASVQVSPSNEISIIVPLNLPAAKIESVLKRKTPWILSKIKFNEEVKYPHKPKELVSGEAFQYLGRNYRLKVIYDDTEKIEFRNGRLCVSVPKGHRTEKDTVVRRLLTEWYITNAKKKLRERTSRYAARLGVSCGKISVKTFKRQWGSCSPNGDISFNWKIIIAPVSIVDYVVLHELCHRLFQNHSPKFWAHIQRVMPDYKARKEWLRINGALILNTV